MNHKQIFAVVSIFDSAQNILLRILYTEVGKKPSLDNWVFQRQKKISVRLRL